MNHISVLWSSAHPFSYDELCKALHQVRGLLPGQLAGVDIGQYAQKLQDKADIVVARDHGDAVVGFLAMYANDMSAKVAFVSVLAVTESFQSQGIGGRLIEEAVRMAKARGMSEVRLKVHPDNAAAMTFYRKHGFIEDGFVDGVVKYSLLIA